MKRIFKRLAKGIVGIVLVGAGGGGIFAWSQASAFDESVRKTYDVPPLVIARSADPDVTARGKHLVESIAGCATRDCHGVDLAGGSPIDMGPVALLCGPNITGDHLAEYSDGELGRLLRHGIKKDGRTIRFMPVNEFDWLPDADITAIVSYLRTVQPIEKPNAAVTDIHLLGKILDRQGKLPLDIARRIDHDKIEPAPPRGPTPEYGRALARACLGCHGDHLSGGPIPGAPSTMPVPLNITPHASGIAEWTFDDFAKLLDTGVRKNGKALNPFMPFAALGKLDDLERDALWAYLRSVPPRPFGQR